MGNSIINFAYTCRHYRDHLMFHFWKFFRQKILIFDKNLVKKIMFLYYFSVMSDVLTDDDREHEYSNVAKIYFILELKLKHLSNIRTSKILTLFLKAGTL